MTEGTASRRTFLRGAGGTLIVATGVGSFLAGRGDVASANPTAQAALAAAATQYAGPGAGFIHPGLLHSQQDLERMRTAVAAQEEPIYQGFQAMAAHHRSSLDYTIRNTGQITSWGRGPTDFTNEAADDAAAAYQQALMWSITGDVRHADKARDILNVWSSSLRSITGADGQLGTGLQGFKLVNAAEILRHSDYDGWAADDIARCEDSFTTVWYRSVSGYALFANGNWDTAALQTIIAIGVFCDDRVMFEDAVRYAVDGPGNGTITNIVVEETGQGQESGRSQAYAQLAIGLLTDAAEIAWNQGVNLYGYADNRILAGFEYNSRYNLGDDAMPFVPDLDRTGKYIKTAISSNNRGQYRPIHEQAYGHYVSRMGLSAPFTEQVVFRGSGGSRHVEGTDDDHPSWGTLTHARPPAEESEPQAAPAAPAGLVADGSSSGITVSWVESVEPVSTAPADSYTVRRATTGDGQYETIATDVTSTSYTDEDVTAGQTYVYVLSASNEVGESPVSLGIAVSAGLPSPWETGDVGDVETPGATNFDGQAFVLEDGGRDIAGPSDAFRFTYVPMTGDGTLTARVVYPVSSQYAKVGLMMRESLDADSAHASMLIQGLALHAWSGVWTTRPSAGAETTGTGSTLVPPTQQEAITVDAGFAIANHGSLPESATPLPAPYVEGASDGYRMRRPYWVRLERSGTTFTGWISPDGEQWTEVGSSELDLGGELYVGLAACSVLGVQEDYAETTTAAFDNVSVPGWSVDVPANPVGEVQAWTGDSAVELAWSGVDMSGRYTVKRATTSGGPYTAVATGVGPVGFGVQVRYADATGTPGTEYYYVVSAVNVAGEGPSSAEVSATMPTPQAPVVESTTMAYANAGVPFEYLIRATNSPTGFSASGLPDGLSVDSETGIISGVPDAGGEFIVEVGAVNATGTGTETVTLAVGTPPPAPWDYRDIGDYVLDERMLGTYSVVTIRTPGITGYDDETGAFTVRGAGSDLNVINQGMTVQYAYVPLRGDSAIIARVADRENAGAADRVGLIMSKSLSPFDQMAGAILTSTGSGDAGVKQFFRRPRVAFRPTVTDGEAGVGVPVWLRLQREGDTFSAATSADGETWTEIGDPDTIPTFGDAPFYVGMAVVSGDPMVLNTTVFDQVSVTPWFADETVNAVVHEPFDHRVTTATGATFEAEGLPPGLSIDAENGQISGKPAALGAFEVTVTATNAAGSFTGTVTVQVGLQTPLSYDTVAGYVAQYHEDGVLDRTQERRLTTHLSVAERFADRGQAAQAAEALDRFAEVAAGVADENAREVLLAAVEALRQQL
ncbi:putative Ig domain-containing protein [Phytoactinopolyspora endophytica]|uniref:putative Ig domain-containing protein n=1 Tax=Phytoactinopolyspora endophytica TaxID=1642495 RepID=UPI0013ED1849|nr:alginate lyase family protein [Phytoactinopolyspora endophytica]